MSECQQRPQTHTATTLPWARTPNLGRRASQDSSTHSALLLQQPGHWGLGTDMSRGLEVEANGLCHKYREAR
jgi:hypothetical protein